MDLENTLQSPISWDELWMKIAKEVANKSKDPSTKVGCVIVSPDNSRITVGYNGFPAKKIPDYSDWWNNRDRNSEDLCKYDVVNHGEINAIFQSKCDLTGWTMYVTHRPCLDCARIIITSGIKRVCFISDNMNMDLKCNKVDLLFSYANIELSQLTLP